MRIMTFLLIVASISVAQAKVYKCPGKQDGQYTYQERPCKGSKPDEHTMSIVPADERKIAAAQAALAKKLNPDNSVPIKEPMTESNEKDTSANKKQPTNTEKRTTTTPPAPVQSNMPQAVPPAASTAVNQTVKPAPIVANPPPAKDSMAAKPSN